MVGFSKGKNNINVSGLLGAKIAVRRVPGFRVGAAIWSDGRKPTLEGQLWDDQFPIHKYYVHVY